MKCSGLLKKNTEKSRLLTPLQKIKKGYNRCARIGATKETVIGGFTLCPTYQLSDQIAIRLDTKFLKSTENILKGENWDMQFNAGVAFKF